MNRDLLVVTAGVLALAVTALLVPSSSMAVPLDRIELHAYRGGTCQWCTQAVVDADGVHCDTCTSNGNGQYVKCDTTAQQTELQYIIGQSPAECWVLIDNDCGGTATTYTNATCSTMAWPIDQDPCLRTFKYANREMIDQTGGINCVAP